MEKEFTSRLEVKNFTEQLYLKKLNHFMQYVLITRIGFLEDFYFQLHLEWKVTPNGSLV